MTINEIKTAIIKLLRAETDIENITAEDVEQADFPLLHIQITPLNSSLFSLSHDARLWSKSLFIDISYMEETRTDNAKLYDMLEKINGIFGHGFYVGKRFLHIGSSNFNITDDIGHYTTTINFTDGAAVPVHEPLAERIDCTINIRKD